METHRERRYKDTLRRRRQEIHLTLRHLENERRQVEANTEWLNHAAYQSRIDLLNRLTSWYRDEISHIENAIGEDRSGASDRCAACGKPMDANRLAIAPDAKFCVDCLDSREGIEGNQLRPLAPAIECRPARR